MIHEWKPCWSYEEVNESHCRAAVSGGGRGVVSHQCVNRATYDEKWCSIHKPGAAEERAAKRGPTQFERRIAAIDAEADRRADLETELERLRAIVDPIVKLTDDETEKTIGLLISSPSEDPTNEEPWMVTTIKLDSGCGTSETEYRGATLADALAKAVEADPIQGGEK